MSIALVVVLIYAKIKKISLKIKQRDLLQFLIAGVLIAAHWVCFFQAIEVSNVSTTLATLSTGAFFASLLEPLIYGRKVVWYEVFFGILVMFGLYLIYGVSGGNFLNGMLLALCAAFLSAAFSIINGKFAETQNSAVVSIFEIIGGIAALSIYMGFQGEWTASFFDLTWQEWAGLLLLGVVCTAYPFVKTISIMRHITPYTVMLSINLEPVYGIILAVMLFPETEKMGVEFYIGAGIILLTVILNVWLKKIKK